MAISLDASDRKSETLNASNAQVVQDANGAAIQPRWLLISGTGTAVTVYVEIGGALTDNQATGSSGGIKSDRAVAADGTEWIWVGSREVALSGSGATAVVIEAIR